MKKAPALAKTLSKTRLVCVPFMAGARASHHEVRTMGATIFCFDFSGGCVLVMGYRLNIDRKMVYGYLN